MEVNVQQPLDSIHIRDVNVTGGWGRCEGGTQSMCDHGLNMGNMKGGMECDASWKGA